jgi:hypothetical protein
MKPRAFLPIVTAVVISVTVAARGGASSLQDGDSLGPSNWEMAKGLLPDEILAHYQRGEYVNRVMDLPALNSGIVLNPPDLLDGAGANHGRYALTAAGSIVDAERYLGCWTSKYDRAGTLVASYQVLQGAYYSLNGGRTYVPGATVGVQTAENFLYKRATVVLFPPRNRENPTDFRVPLSRELFSPDVLVRLGR